MALLVARIPTGRVYTVFLDHFNPYLVNPSQKLLSFTLLKTREYIFTQDPDGASTTAHLTAPAYCSLLCTSLKVRQASINPITSITDDFI